MIQDNKDFTERQKRILEKVGEKYRPKIETEKKRNTILGVLSYFVCLGVLIIILMEDFRYIYNVIVLSIAGIFALTIGLVLYHNKLNDLVKGDDYHIGLYYGHLDVRIIGNNKRLLNKVVLVSILFAISSLMFSIIMGIASYAIELPNYSQMNQITGMVEYIDLGSNRELEVKFVNDDHKYTINSIFYNYIDYDELLNFVKPSEIITIYVEQYENNDKFISIYYLKHDGNEYLGHSNFVEGFEANIKISFVSFIVSSVIFLSCIIWIALYKILIFNKNVLLEEYDLEFTQIELNEMKKNTNRETVDDFTLKKAKNVEIKQSKRNINLTTSFAIIFTLIAIVVFFTAEDTTNRNIGTIAILIIALMIWFGAISCFVNKEIIKDKKFIKKRLFLTKIVDFKDIKMVKISFTLVLIKNHENKEILSAFCQSKKLDGLINAFESEGIYVEKL